MSKDSMGIDEAMVIQEGLGLKDSWGVSAITRLCGPVRT